MAQRSSAAKTKAGGAPSSPSSETEPAQDPLGGSPAAPEAPTVLTAAMQRELRRPFTVRAIRFKPQVVSKDKSKAMATFYIDGRLAVERLNEIVGPAGWEDDYRVLFEANPSAHGAAFFPIECRLTVLGITKVDVGVYQKNKADWLSTKAGYSDALKRAAVKFGVGAYLYAMPKVWAETKTYGQGEQKKVDGFSEAGLQVLRSAYEKACKDLADRFGTPLDHGEVDDPVSEEDASSETGGSETDSPATNGSEKGSGSRTGQTTRQGASQTINPAQRRKLMATIREAELPLPIAREIVAVSAGVISTNEIPKAAFNNLLGDIAGYVANPEAGDGLIEEWRAQADPEFVAQLDAKIKEDEEKEVTNAA